jgi:hypothetical protein
MPHYPLIVCLPPGTTRTQLIGELTGRLEPFSAAHPVAPYRRYLHAVSPRFFALVSLSGVDHGLDLADPGLSWAQVAEMFNRHLDIVAAPGQPRMRVDGDGRPYAMTTANPRAKFRDWRIGGHYTGHFLARPGLGRDDTVRIVSPRPSPTSMIETVCDGGPVRLLALAAMRGRARTIAAEAYDLWERAVAGTPAARPIEEFLDRRREDPAGYPSRRAAADYLAQPRVAALTDWDLAHDPVFFDEEDPAGYDSALAEFQVSRQLFLRHHGQSGPLGHALLTLDGDWLQPAAATPHATRGELVAARHAYVEQTAAYLDRLAGDTVLVCVELTHR